MRFRHAGLRRFWERDDSSRLPTANVARINRLLDDLAAAETPADMNLPGLRLHQLSGNLRLTFRFVDSEAVDIDLEDYHQEVNG